MNKGKSIFVTMLIAVMLVLIDIGLYILSKTGFVVLTGTLALYGYFRGAGDFRRWMVKEPSVKVAPVFEPVSFPNRHKVYDWSQDNDPATTGSSDNSTRESPIYDVLIVDE